MIVSRCILSSLSLWCLISSHVLPYLISSHLILTQTFLVMSYLLTSHISQLRFRVSNLLPLSSHVSCFIFGLSSPISRPGSLISYLVFLISYLLSVLACFTSANRNLSELIFSPLTNLIYLAVSTLLAHLMIRSFSCLTNWSDLSDRSHLTRPVANILYTHLVVYPCICKR